MINLMFAALAKRAFSSALEGVNSKNYSLAPLVVKAVTFSRSALGTQRTSDLLVSHRILFMKKVAIRDGTRNFPTGG